MRVLLGGTFEIIHKGHERLLKKALRFSDVIIGLTSDGFAKREKKRKILSFEKRKAALWKFLGKHARKVKIFPLDDKFGIAASDELADAIIVSEETKRNALEINKLRARRKLKPLKIISLPLALAYDGRKISAERILNGEIRRDGERAGK